MTSSTTKILTSLIAFLGQSPAREKLCRLVQYFANYLIASYQETNELQPHLRNQLNAKIKKVSALQGSMGMARKILRFGPSIACTKTVILNAIEIIKGKNKQSTPLFATRTLSALFIALYFVCDHYLWLHKMGLAKDNALKDKMDFYAILWWYLDCYVGLLKNYLIYSNLTETERKRELKAIIIDTVRALCDLPLAYGFMYPGKVNGKIMGALGTTSSIIGMYQLWK